MGVDKWHLTFVVFYLVYGVNSQVQKTLFVTDKVNGLKETFVFNADPEDIEPDSSQKMYFLTQKDDGTKHTFVWDGKPAYDDDERGSDIGSHGIFKRETQEKSNITSKVQILISLPFPYLSL